MRPILCILAFFSLIFISCSKKDEGYTGGNLENLSYGPDPLQTMDVMFPSANDRSGKCVMLIHGGGWTGGDKSDCRYFSSVFSGQGYVAIQVNYRLAGDKIHFGEMLADIASAISFAISHSKEWKIDISSLNLFGHSAGAHLALLCAYKGSVAPSVKNVIALSAATDLNDSLLLSIPGNRESISILTGDTSVVHRNEASPFYYVTPSSVPTILIHGKNDPFFPFRQSALLYEDLQAAGVRSRIVLFGNEGHELYPPHISDEDNMVLWSEIFEFIEDR